MSVADLGFFITEAWIGMKRSGLMITLTIGTVILSLVMFGFFLLGSVNLQNLSHFLSSKLEVRVFLKDSLTMPEISEFENRVFSLETVQTVNFVHKDDAWKSFKDNFQNLAIDDDLSDNPLPHTIMVKAKPGVSITSISETLGGFKEVEEVVYGGEIATRLESFSRLSRVGGLIIVAILGLSTLLIIINTIRLTVIARQDEISIMKLVGAADSFIKWPFLIEGLIIGCFGATLSIAILKLLYSVMVVKIQSSLPFIPLVFNSENIWAIYAAIGLTGAFLGLLGAYISVSRSLKSQL